METWWPLEEETEAGQVQGPEARAHTVMSCRGVGWGEAAGSPQPRNPGGLSDTPRTVSPSAHPSSRVPVAPTVSSNEGRWQSRVVRGGLGFSHRSLSQTHSSICQMRHG